MKLGIVTFDGIDESQMIDFFRASFKNLKAPIQIVTLKADNYNYKRGVEAI
jgi:hypothetical protein